MTGIETKNYKAGEVIYNINDPADKIYLIHNGKVRVKSKMGLNLGVLIEGEMFGEVGPIIEETRTVTVIAETNCTLKEIDDATIHNKLDGEFKYHLDRYKYDTRFKDAKREEHKYKARDLLVNLNDRLEEKKWLNGDNISLSDISILPFIRQYRIADIKWFDEQLELPNINRWLDNFLNSKTLNNVMKKYKIWETTDPKIFL